MANIFAFIIAVAAILQAMGLGLVSVIKSFNEWGKYNLNYYKTQSDYNFLKKNAYVKLSLYIVALLLQILAICRLYTVLL
jgi:hypothetical protein